MVVHPSDSHDETSTSPFLLTLLPLSAPSPFLTGVREFLPPKNFGIKEDACR